MAPHDPVQFHKVIHDNNGQLYSYSLHPASHTELHYHNLIEIGWCLQGNGTFITEDQIQNYEAGDVEIVFPYQKHFAFSKENEESQWYFINLDFQNILRNPESPILYSDLSVFMQREIGAYGVFHPKQAPEVANIVYRLIHTKKEPGIAAMRAEVLLLTQLFLELSLLSLNRQPYPRSGNRQSYTKIEPAIILAQQRIRQGEKVLVSDLSQACSLSDGHFRRIFKTVLGCSPQQYINDLIIAQAKFLLIETNASILDIANSVGFDDASGFNRAFLRSCGMTPTAFRALV